jgi:hypothetical protein
VRQLRRNVRLQLAIPVAVAALLAGGCGGQSASDKAASQVCDATSDIQKQVDTLRGIDQSSVAVGTVQGALRGIQADLSSIAQALPNLAGDRRQQVQAANAEFKQALSDTVAGLASGLSMDLDDGAGRVSGAVAKLAESYKASFARVAC